MPTLGCCANPVGSKALAGFFISDLNKSCVFNQRPIVLDWNGAGWTGSYGGFKATLSCGGLSWSYTSGACSGSASGAFFQCFGTTAGGGGGNHGPFTSDACCGEVAGLTLEWEADAQQGVLPSGKPQPRACSLSSANPIIYSTGEIQIAGTDIQSSGFGVPWGHTRSFASRQSVNETLGQGYCWQVREWSYALINDDNSVVIQRGPASSIWFDLVNGAFVPRFDSKQSLVHDTANSVYRLTDIDGTVTTFDDFTGMFRKQADPAGNTIQVTAIAGNGFNFSTVQRTYSTGGNTTTEQFSYSYDTSSGDYLLTSVLLQRRVNNGAFANVAQAQYTYYTAGDPNGGEEDLKTVTTQLFSNGAWANTGTTNYRYWKQLPSSSSSSSSSSGSSSVPSISVHLLKFVLQPTMYDQMVAAGSNPLTASDAQLSLFADYYFEYDTTRRCTKETVKSGSQTFTFAYTQSANSNGYNSWATKTIETLPDGNQNIVYCNYAGQTMLMVFQSGSDKWSTYYQYDANAKLVYQANPSAVSGFDETHADLVNWQGGTAQYLNKTSGLIQTFTFDPTSGFLSGELVQQGQWGLPIIVRQYEYVACCPTGSSSSSLSSSSSKSSSSGSSTSSSSSGGCATPVYFLSKVIEYPDDGSSGSSSSSSSSRSSGPASGTANGNTRQIITTYAYTFWPGTCAIQQKTTTWPVIPTSQNGSGVAAQMLEYFDKFGNLLFKMDERGFITGMTYDIPTGTMTQRIDDVNTSLVSAPPGWTTPSGGGLHLITNFLFDAQSRQTQSLGPVHTIDIGGVATSIRRATWTVYQDALFQTWQGRGYATAGPPSSSSSASSSSSSSSAYNVFTLINPVAITITMKDGKITDQIQAVRYVAGTSSSSSSSGSSSSTGCPATAPLTTPGALSAFDSFPQCSYVRWTTIQYSDCCFVASQRVYKLIPATGTGVSGTNYDETDFGYEVTKRQNRVVTPGGTIARTVFDARGRPTAAWIGTDDTGATASNPGGSGSPNNMVQITGLVYDRGSAGGDSNITKKTDYVDGTGTNDRVTAFLYDFRNRPTDTDGEIDLYAKQYFDNLDRVYRNERYNTSLAGNLIMLSTTSWDDRGAAFQGAVYSVDPSTGAIGNALTSNTWRDASRNIVKSLPAGSQPFVKTTFDSLGRKAVEYTGYGTDANYDEIFSVSTNTILEQIEIAHDAASNAIQTTGRLRYHNAPASQLGALGDPTTTPNARVTYSALYPDALGRTQGIADSGTDGGVLLSRPSTIPARSDTCLVTAMRFDAAANRASTTDPANAVACFGFDAVPRETSRITNCTAASSSSSSSSSSAGCARSLDTNVTILTTYTPDGQVDSIAAINPLTNNQVTRFVYGTTLATSAVASSLLKALETLPDSVTGSDQITWTYNRQGQKTSLADQNGTVHSYNYDKLGRETDDRITTLGTGIDNAVLRISGTYEARSMRQNLTSYDNATVGSGSVVNDVQFTYNSFQQLVADYQSHTGTVNVSTTAKVQYAYADGSANTARLTSMTYPNARVLNYNYGAAAGIADSASRIASLIDNDGVTHLADYSYVGGSAQRAAGFTPAGSANLPTLASPFSPTTAVSVTSPQPGIQYTLIGLQGGTDFDTGDIYRGLDRFSRVKDLIWAPIGGSSASSSSGSSGPGTNLIRIQHTYDRMSNRLSRRDLVAESYGVGLDELYGYDLVNRLKALDRGSLSSGSPTISSKKFAQCWTLDTTGNWSGFREDDNGDGTWDLVQSRSANAVNEITGITNAVGSAWIQPKYDAAGNMSTVPQPVDPTKAYTCKYDAWNRLVKVVDAPSGNTVAQYAYDGAKRRTIKQTYTAGVLSETRHFFYTDPQRWQVVEERVGTSTNAERQFVWGLRYIDDLIMRDRDTTGNGTLNERLYGLQDPNWNMLAVVNSIGVVQERYSYDAYGSAAFLTGSFAPRFASLFAWETLYAGYRWDSNSGLYPVRSRVLGPLLGWLQRDSIYSSTRYDLYAYASCSPLNVTDPSGQVPVRCECYDAGGAGTSDFAPTPGTHWVTTNCDPGGGISCCRSACGSSFSFTGNFDIVGARPDQLSPGPGYWYYLTNPSQMDTDLYILFIASWVVAAVASVAAIVAASQAAICAAAAAAWRALQWIYFRLYLMFVDASFLLFSFSRTTVCRIALICALIRYLLWEPMLGRGSWVGPHREFCRQASAICFGTGIGGGGAVTL